MEYADLARFLLRDDWEFHPRHFDASPLSIPMLKRMANVLWDVTGQENWEKHGEKFRVKAMQILGDMCLRVEVRDYLVTKGIVGRLHSQLLFELDNKGPSRAYNASITLAIEKIFEKGAFAGHEDAIDLFLPLLCRQVDENANDGGSFSNAVTTAANMAKIGDSARVRIAESGLLTKLMRRVSTELHVLGVLQFATEIASSEKGIALLFTWAPDFLEDILRTADLDASSYFGILRHKAIQFIWMLSTVIHDAKSPEAPLSLSGCQGFRLLWETERSNMDKLWLLQEVVTHLNYKQLTDHLNHSFTDTILVACKAPAHAHPFVQNVSAMSTIALGIVHSVLREERKAGASEWRRIFLRSGILGDLRRILSFRSGSYGGANLAGVVAMWITSCAL